MSILREEDDSGVTTQVVESRSGRDCLEGQLLMFLARSRFKYVIYGILFGEGIGTVIGLGLGNTALWFAIGSVAGFLFGLSMAIRCQNTNDP
jgi:hypothetical protein